MVMAWKVAAALAADRSNVKTKKVANISPAFGCELAFKLDWKCSFALCTWCKQEEQAIDDSVPDWLLKDCENHVSCANLVAHDDTMHCMNKHCIHKNPLFAHICVKCGFNFGTSKQAA